MYTRDAARFSNPGGQAVMRRAKSAPLVIIGFTELPNSEWAKAHPAHLLAASLRYQPDFKISSNICLLIFFKRCYLDFQLFSNRKLIQIPFYSISSIFFFSIPDIVAFANAFFIFLFPAYLQTRNAILLKCFNIFKKTCQIVLYISRNFKIII